MRRGKASLGLALSFVFVACNAILGNEEDYTLIGQGGSAGGGSGGARGGTAGRPGMTDAGGGGADAGAGAGGSAGAEAGAGGIANGGTGGSNAGRGGTSSSAGAAGEAGQGGVGGNGGASGCAVGAVEDCFNGVDDDCNQLADCADPACAAPADCVVASAGSDPGMFLAPGQTKCPAGYSAVTLYQGLSADPACLGCTCTPEASRCDSGVYGLGPNTCPGFQYSTILYNVFSDRCEAMPADTKLHFFDVRGFATCTAGGTPRTSPATWASTQTFCKADKIGVGCGSGSRCVPSTGAPKCSMKTGAGTCGAGSTAPAGGSFYTGFTDSRTCTACQCGFGISKCTGGVIQVYSGGACTGSVANLGSGAQGDSCGALPFVPASARISGTPESTSCPPNSYPNGDLTATGERTVCCTN